MKINNILLIIFPVAALAATSCSHDDLELYHGIDAGIYIQEVGTTDYYGNIVEYRNEGKPMSFADYGPDVMVLDAGFNVKIMGNIKDYDRPYIIKIDSEKTTAVEGVDFDWSENDFTIKAGEAYDRINVKLYRNEHVRQNTLQICFVIEENEHFIIPFEDYNKKTSWYTESETIKSTTWKITYGEIYTKPTSWNSDIFGPWTVNKFFMLNQLMGLTIEEWKAADRGLSSKIGMGRLRYAAKLMRNHLQELADGGTPALDDDGSYMQLGSEFQVNYSAYETN